MSHNPASVRAYQRQLIRDSYAKDPRVAEARYIYELQLAQGDARLAFRKGLPEQGVVDALGHVFALWRTP